MPNSYFATPLIFLIETLFGLYISLVALRLVMQWAKWEYHNPLVQFIIKMTQPPVKFLRQFIPAIKHFDTATGLLLLTLTLIKVILINLLQPTAFSGLMILRIAVADIFSLFITLYTVSIIMQAILSWVANNNYNPITPLLTQMNSPLIKPVRRYISPISGIDLAPFIVLIGLQLVSLLIMPLLLGFYQ